MTESIWEQNLRSFLKEKHSKKNFQNRNMYGDHGHVAPVSTQPSVRRKPSGYRYVQNPSQALAPQVGLRAKCVPLVTGEVKQEHGEYFPSMYGQAESSLSQAASDCTFILDESQEGRILNDISPSGTCHKNDSKKTQLHLDTRFSRIPVKVNDRCLGARRHAFSTTSVSNGSRHQCNASELAVTGNSQRKTKPAFSHSFLTNLNKRRQPHTEVIVNEKEER